MSDAPTIRVHGKKTFEFMKLNRSDDWHLFPEVNGELERINHKRMQLETKRRPMGEFKIIESYDKNRRSLGLTRFQFMLVLSTINLYDIKKIKLTLVYIYHLFETIVLYKMPIGRGRTRKPKCESTTSLYGIMKNYLN